MPKKTIIPRSMRGVLLSIFCAGLLANCAILDEARWQEPEINVLSTQLVNLTPTEAQLSTRFEVLNPNVFSVTMGALDYALEVNGARVLSGEQGTQNRLEARGRQEITLPITLEFEQLAQLVSGFASRDSIDYQVTGGMSFDIPVAGSLRVPAEASGSLPIPKLPQIQVEDLVTRNLSFTGVDLLLNLRVSNPNAFALLLDRFSYEFALNDMRVAGGEAQQTLELTEGDSGLIELPISLSFDTAGRSLYSAIVSGQPLNYGLSFASDLRPDLPEMDIFPFNVTRDGEIRLR